jgi:phytoene dehydrogenase-like protein
VPKYDLAVAGAGLGGLAVAALMSKSGKKVSVLESGASLDAALGVREFDGFRFFHGPTLSYGFEQGGAFQDIFAKLGDTPEVLNHADCFQVALPDRRITVSANQEETHDELMREFPREIQTIEKFYLDLKKQAGRISKSGIVAYFAKRKSAAGFVGKYHFSREFIIFLEIQTRYFFRKSLSQLSLAKLITLIETMPIRFSGGGRALADRLLDALRKSGGDITFGEGPGEIEFKDGRLAGVKTDQRMIEANSILLNAPHQQPPTYYLGILDDVVPVGMKQDVLYLPDYARPDEFLSISVSADNDISSAPMSARALTVSLRSSNNLQRDQDALIGPLAEIIPFLDENVFFIEPSPVVSPSFKLMDDVTFKPLRSSEKRPLLFKTSKRHLYVLHEAQYMPLELMTAAHRFVASLL